MWDVSHSLVSALQQHLPRTRLQESEKQNQEWELVVGSLVKQNKTTTEQKNPTNQTHKTNRPLNSYPDQRTCYSGVGGNRCWKDSLPFILPLPPPPQDDSVAQNSHQPLQVLCFSRVFVGCGCRNNVQTLNRGSLASLKGFSPCYFFNLYFWGPGFEPRALRIWGSSISISNYAKPCLALFFLRWTGKYLEKISVCL